MGLNVPDGRVRITYWPYLPKLSHVTCIVPNEGYVWKLNYMGIWAWMNDRLYLKCLLAIFKSHCQTWLHFHKLGYANYGTNVIDQIYTILVLVRVCRNCYVFCIGTPLVLLVWFRYVGLMWSLFSNLKCFYKHNLIITQLPFKGLKIIYYSWLATFC